MKSNAAERRPSIVFCHGLWADGSCFSKLIVPLQAEGYECITAQYGLNSTAEDVELTKATIGRVSSPVILVGHSYGGSVITGAGTDDRVAGLVYICALAPDADESSQTQQSNFPRTPVFSHIDVKDGRIWLLPEGIDDFAGDLTEQEKKLVLATQGVPKPGLFEAKAGGTAWKSKQIGRASHGSSRSGTVLCEAHGRNHLRARQQPRAHALPTGTRPRRNPYRRKSGSTSHGSSVTPLEFCNGPAISLTVQLDCDDISSSPAEQLQELSQAVDARNVNHG